MINVNIEELFDLLKDIGTGVTIQCSDGNSDAEEQSQFLAQLLLYHH